jgi:AcrR family transcriptional regulator
MPKDTQCIGKRYDARHGNPGAQEGTHAPRERGYTETTISDIAEAADIGRRTFFSYFPSKEDVVFADLSEFLDAFEAHMAERDPGEGFVASLRAWLAERAETEEKDPARSAARRALVAANDELQARERRLLARAEEIVAVQIAAELGDDPDGVRPRFVSAALTATMVALGRSKDDLTPEAHAVRMQEGLDDVLAFLEGGLEALRQRRETAAPA